MKSALFENLGYAVLQDVRFALRGLRRSPGFAAAAIITLALGIGATTAIFSVVNAVLLRPLSYPQADRIVEFVLFSAHGETDLSSNLASIPRFHVYQQQTNAFDEVAAYDFTSPGFSLTGDRPEQLRGIHVTEGYFRLFGAPVILGRTFTRQEDSPHGGKVVVLSYGLWQRRFSGDPLIVGKPLSLGNEPYTVVGVAGPQFAPDPAADLWLPFQFEAADTNMNQFFQVAGRLRPGVTLAQANAQMKLASAQLHRTYPNMAPGEVYGVQPLQDNIVGNARRSLLVMLGAVGLVLLIASANVANLLLLRATTRKRELAIRAALGASRIRVLRQLLIESVLLAFVGGLLGLGLGFGGVRTLLAFSPPGLPRIGEDGAAIPLDWRVLGFVLAVSFATAILFGLAPALRASRADLSTALKQGSSRSGTGTADGRARSLLVISEVSLSLVLLVGSALLIRTALLLHAVSPGFDAGHVLTLDMSMTGARLHTSAGIGSLSQHGRDRLLAIPAVAAAATGTWLPIEVNDGLPFQIVGKPAERNQRFSRWMSASPGYLDVFRIPLLRGRDFKDSDTQATPGVALITVAMARQYWPGEDPVGRQILIGQGMGPGIEEPARTIVGIIGDTHNVGLAHPPEAMVVVPIAQVPDAYAAAYSDTSALFWVVRTHGDPHQVTAAAAEQLRLASGGLAVAHVRTMDEVMGHSTSRQNFNMLLLSILGGLALMLAAIGIYGLIAYSVAQRAQEMGIRIALGAGRPAILKLIVWQGMRLALIGVALGLVAAASLTRLMASFLFGVRPWDPAAFLFAPVLLAAVASLAVWLPGARAARTDPVRALRTE